MARICPTCHGDRRVLVGTGHANDWGEEIAYDEDCSTCDGIGEVLAFDGVGCA